ncbi:Ig-like domain-containing protein [Paenibacillus thalictri]|uniref:Ig-like domain-containing protein n=1 Tax=Paenibacillus thalictri TaxID=2527873 RepID=UPI0013EF518F|nr:Ig-like domain-containing protein [Paenibacillus thalictri]
MSVLPFFDPSKAEAAATVTVFKNSRTEYEIATNIKDAIWNAGYSSNMAPIDTIQTVNGVTYSYQLERNGAGTVSMKWLKNNYSGTDYYDLSGFASTGSLDFDIRGNVGGEAVEVALNKASVSGASAQESSRCKITATAQWTHISIPLNNFKNTNGSNAAACSAVGGTYTTAVQASFDTTFAQVRQIGMFDYSSSLGKIWVSDMKFTSAYVNSYSAVNSSTPAGTAPTLPSTVNAVFSDASTQPLNVTWNLTPSQYAAPGTVTVTGKVDGAQLQPTATLTVTTNLPHTFVSYDTIAAVSTIAGTAPGLPAKIKASFQDAVKEDVSVNWNAVNASQYAGAGTFTVSGTTSPTPAQTANGVPTQNVSVTVNVAVLPTITVFKDTRMASSSEIPAGMAAVLFDATQSKDGVTPSYNLQRSSSSTTYWAMKWLKSTTLGDNWNLNNYAVNGSFEFDLKGKNAGEVVTFALNTVDNGSNAESARCELTLSTQWTHYSIPLSRMNASVIPSDTTCTSDSGVGKQTSTKQANFDISKVRQVGLFSYDGRTEQVWVSDMKFNPVYITGYQAINLTTQAGVAPNLPSVVTAVYSDASTKSINVTWNAITSSQYDTIGQIFTVQGTTDKNIQLQPKATVTVTNGQPHTYASFDALPAQITVSPNEAPVLPSTVKVNYLDLAKEDVAIQWSAIDPAKYAAGPASFTATGTTAPTPAQIASGVPVQAVSVTIYVNPTLTVFKNNRAGSELINNLNTVLFDTTDTADGVTPSYNLQRSSTGAIWSMKFLKSTTLGNNWDLTNYTANGALEFDIKGRPGEKIVTIALNALDNGTSNAESARCEVPVTDQWRHYAIPISKLNSAATPNDKTCTTIAAVGNLSATKQSLFDISKVRQVGIFDYVMDVEQVRVSNMRFTASYVNGYSLPNVNTAEGVAPNLPSTVNAVMSDGGTQPLNVSWSVISPNQYASAGTSFLVKGTVAGVQLQPTVKVTVTNGQPHVYAGLDAIAAVSTNARIAPVLPGTVIANFQDASQEEVAVEWETVAAPLYSKELQAFNVKGKLKPTPVQLAAGVPGGDAAAAQIAIAVAVLGPADITIFHSSASPVAGTYAGNGFSLTDVPFDTVSEPYNGLGSHNVKVTGSSGYWGVMFRSTQSWQDDYPSFEAYVKNGSLEFNVKGRSGGESFKLSLYDETDNLSTEAQVINVTNEWKHISIPMDSFVYPKGFSMSKIRQISLTSNSASAMEFWLNDMRVTSDTLMETQPIAVSTVAFVDPIPPAGVNAAFKSTATRYVKISWDLNSNDYLEVGDVVLKGRLIESGAPISTVVKVRKTSAPHQFKRFKDIQVTTYAETPPTMPTTARVLFDDGVGETVAVTAWDPIATSMYAEGAAPFRLNGATTYGTVAADVYVRTPVSFKPISLNTLAGEVPVLPEMATIVYNDNTTLVKSVAWDVMPSLNYASEGAFQTKGQVAWTEVVNGVSIAKRIKFPVIANIAVLSQTTASVEHNGLGIFRNKDVNNYSWGWGHLAIEDTSGEMKTEGQGAMLPFDTDVTYDGVPSYRFKTASVSGPTWAGWGATIPFPGHQKADGTDTLAYDLSSYLELGALNFYIKGASGTETFNIGLSSTGADDKITTKTIEFKNYGDTYWHPVSIPLKQLIGDTLDVKNISHLQFTSSNSSPIQFWISDMWISKQPRHLLSGFDVPQIPVFVLFKDYKISLPATVAALYTDGTQQQMNVKWDSYSFDDETQAIYVFGTVDGIEMRPKAYLYAYLNSMPGSFNVIQPQAPVVGPTGLPAGTVSAPIAPPVLPPLNQILTNGSQGIYKVESDNVKLQGDRSIVTVGMDTINQGLTQTALVGDLNKVVIIHVPESSEARGYGVELPVQALASGTNDKTIELITPLGSISLPGNMLQAADVKGSETVQVVFSTVDKSKLSAEAAALIGDRPVFDITMQAGEAHLPWSNPEAPVRISLNYSPTSEELDQPEHMVALYIADDGSVTGLPSGRYDRTGGRISFVTTHFSQYAISFVKKTFGDLSGYGWAQKEIELLASKGVVNGTSDTTFSPEGKLTRGAFITLLARTLNLTAKADSNFSDVSNSAYYAQPVAVAKKLGITTGIGGNMFAPDEEISRQDMMVITARALQAVGQLSVEEESLEPNAYDDQADIRDYAKISIAALRKAGLVQGSNGKVYPNASMTRAETAVLMHRIYTK